MEVRMKDGGVGMVIVENLGEGDNGVVICFLTEASAAGNDPHDPEWVRFQDGWTHMPELLLSGWLEVPVHRGPSGNLLPCLTGDAAQQESSPGHSFSLRVHLGTAAVALRHCSGKWAGGGGNRRKRRAGQHANRRFW